MTDPSFKIYFLADSTLSSESINSISLERLPLQSEPILTANDLAGYTITDDPSGYHIIKTKPDVYERLGDEVRPFVLTIDNERIFSGLYFPFMSAAAITEIQLLYAENDEFWLISFTTESTGQLKDPRIIDALEQAGVPVIIDNRGE